MTLDPAVRTRLQPAQAIEALADAHVRIFGIDASDSLIRVVSAWSAFETDTWRAMWGFNFVNIRGAYRGHSTTFKASEIIDGKEVFLPPSAENLFRFYPGAPEGAEDALRFVGTATSSTRPNRYQKAWDEALAGDIPGFVDGLRNPVVDGKPVPGFFTANPRVYQAGVERKALELAPAVDDWRGHVL